MEITFNYIRNRIREHSKEELLQFCHNVLDDKRDKIKPIWFVFLLMKWTYLYGGEKNPSKPLTPQKASKILKSITDFNQEHITDFMKDGGIHRAFHILYSQQFYLQTSVYREKFATQLKLYSTISGKYDIQRSFETKTGFKIVDFLFLMQVIWLYTNIDRLEKPSISFSGYLTNNFLKMASELTNVDKVKKLLQLLVLDPINPNEKINSFKRNLKSQELQSMERTFFTLYPLQYFNNKIKVIHLSVFNYSLNYYIYDYLKSFDDNFTTEFGNRFEKYIEFGIKELNCPYIRENELKKQLPKNSKVVDFVIDKNIFVECKAIEVQAYASVNPTDELIYNSLKDSLIKAYFQQLLNVAKTLNGDKENWGIILTYKKLYWSQFSDLYDITKHNFEETLDTMHIPPENVFIIDIHTWDRIISIINDEEISLIEILKIAKNNNSVVTTKKQSFDMHLDVFKNNPLNLNYLKDEIEELNIAKKHYPQQQ
ncbi:MAG TPA: hypothetical protein PKH16_15410 [Aequorivita sp.]|nr:hypothetical protein [Aequorivita sp.]|tara:strand:+ start:38124 stop:39572 length:1449 start_codon:yes stop_codon:yes gene_type:complete